MNYPILIIIAYSVIAILLFGQGRIMRYFNLADKRSLVGSEASYQKLNSLLSAGDVTIYRSEFMSEPRVKIRATYTVNKTESTDINVEGKDFDGVVEASYQAAVAKGFIKE